MVISLFFFGTAGPKLAWAKKKGHPTRIAYLEAARRALVEGDVARAVKVLSLARKCWLAHKEGCGFSQVDYEVLLGVVYMEHAQYRKAAQSFRKVLLKQPARRAVWLYYGQALYELRLFPRSAGALRKAQGVRDDSAVYWILRARAEVKAGELRQARDTLEEGLRHLPEEAGLYRELAFLFSRVGLLCAASKMAYHYAVVTHGDPMAYFYVAEELVAHGRARMAARVLEEARMIRPHDPEVLERLAHAYARAQRPSAAARLYEMAAKLNPPRASRLAYAAAESYRASGHTRRALRANARVDEEKRRLLQRLNIYLGAKKYGRALMLRRPIIRADAMSGSVRYRLAYAAVRLGRFRRASRLLKRVRGGHAAMAGRRAEPSAPCKEEPCTCP